MSADNASTGSPATAIVHEELEWVHVVPQLVVHYGRDPITPL